MRFVLTAAAKDVRRRLADPAALAFWIGIPLVLAGLLSFISNTGGEALRAAVVGGEEGNRRISRVLPAAARQGGRPSGRDTVAGNSYAAWLKRKQAGQVAAPEPADDDAAPDA